MLVGFFYGSLSNVVRNEFVYYLLLISYKFCLIFIGFISSLC